MDGLRFDALPRALVTSRRGVLRALLGTGAAALTAAEIGAAAQDDEQDDPFYRAGLACDGGEPCGSLAPCEFGLCTPKACLIDGIPRDNLAPKPGNSCRFCAPTLESWTNWLGVVENGEPCESTDGDPCRNPSEFALEANVHVNPRWTSSAVLTSFVAMVTAANRLRSASTTTVPLAA